MNLFGTPEFKVGLLVVVVSVLVGAMSMRVSESPNFMGGTKRVFFEIDDAGGLIKNSPVNVAGIRVGMIEDIKLKDGKAVVELVVRPDVHLTKSAKIEIKANGILGDKHVEIMPGSANDPVLQNKGQIMVVEDNASIDKIVSEVSKITNSLGVVVDNIRDATEGDDTKPIGKIVKNIEVLTTDLSQLVGSKKDEVAELIDHLNRVTATLDEMINDPSEEGFRARFERSMARLESSLENIDEISGKINSGEGTIGRLINDEETVEGLNTAIDGINNFIATGSKMQTSFDYYSHVFSKADGVRSYIGLRIQPGLDRFYEIAGVTTPEGVINTNNRTLIVDGAKSEITEINRQQNQLRLTALFGKKFYNWSIKGGMIESRGGLGIEYNFLRNKMRLSIDAFDFEETQVRGYLRYSFFKGLYVTGGQQFTFTENGQDNATSFFGAGLFLTNDDITTLLSWASF